MLWTDAQFWKDASWRSFRTFCQTLAALLGGQTFTALTAPWQSMLSVAATASLISLFQSIDRGRAITTSGPQPETVEVVVDSPEAEPAARVVPLGVAHAVVTACGDAGKS
jgi:hypothetical protein